MIKDLAKKKGLTIRKLPLWEAKFDEQALRKKADTLTLRHFDKGFRQKPISDTERMFPSFMDCVRYGITIEQALPEKERVFIAVGVDLSTPKRPGNVIFTLGIGADSRRVPLDIRMGNWTSPQVAQQLAEVDAHYKPHVIVVENNAYQESIIQWIQALPKQYDFWVKVVSFTTGKQKWADESGLPSLESEFSVGGWVIPFPERHIPDCDCAWCAWVNEMRSYTKLYGVGDTVMACWFAREAVRLYGGTEPVEETIRVPSEIDELSDVFDMVGLEVDEFGEII